MNDYDPEKELELESHIVEMEKMTRKLRKRLGKDHAIVDFCENYGEAFRILLNRHNDYVNCYDPDEKDRLETKIVSLTTKLKDFGERFQQIMKNIC